MNCRRPVRKRAGRQQFHKEQCGQQTNIKEKKKNEKEI